MRQMAIRVELYLYLKQLAVGVLGLDVNDALLVVAGFPVVVGVLVVTSVMGAGSSRASRALRK